MAVTKAQGIFTFNPHEKAPAFVLGTIVINLEDFREFVNGEGKQYLTEYNGKKQLKLQVTSPKEGRGIMVAVDTYKADNSKGNYSKDERKEEFKNHHGNTGNAVGHGDSSDSSDLPFTIMLLLGTFLTTLIF
jgi:hypothetical protein